MELTSAMSRIIWPRVSLYQYSIASGSSTLLSQIWLVTSVQELQTPNVGVSGHEHSPVGHRPTGMELLALRMLERIAAST